jgi:LysR family transcriptional regulator of abg operon
MLLRRIRAFLAIAENGSIRGASRRLGVSQPALTKTLKELESSLSAPLVVRSAQGVTLTKYGEALLVRARLADAELRRAKDEIGQMLGAKGGEIAVGLSPVASLLLAPDALKRFWRSHPTVTIRLIDGLFSHLIGEVQRGILDFSVGPLPPLQVTVLVAEPLFSHRLAPVVRTGHPLAKARKFSELKDSDWLISSSDDDFGELIRAEFTKRRLQLPKIATVCESFPAMLELLMRTDLIALIPVSILQHQMMAKDFVEIPIQDKLPSTVIALVRNAGVPPTPLAAKLAAEFHRAARRYKGQ